MNTKRAILLALSLVATLPGGGARAEGQAERCAGRIDDFRVVSGELAPGLERGVFFGTTDGGTVKFSYGSFMRREPVTLPYEALVTWQRLGSDVGRPSELVFPGGVMMFKEEGYGLYAAYGSFAAEGWHPLAGYRTEQEHTVMIRQDEEGVSLFVDGKALRRFALRAPSARGEIGVAFKGASGHRARMRFSGLCVRPHRGH